MRDTVTETAHWVRAHCNQEGSHDWFHIERVWKLSCHLVELERLGDQFRGLELDTEVVELAALLHDISDAKFNGGDENLGPQIARDWLADVARRFGKPGPQSINQVCAIIATMSYRHGLAGTDDTGQSREYAIVRDADRLDAIGAIGIARAFAYGGAKGRPIWIPGETPVQFRNAETYLAAQGSSFNHFQEKLVHLKDSMLTESGRRIAQERHRFLEQYMARFLAEWEGTI